LLSLAVNVLVGKVNISFATATNAGFHHQGVFSIAIDANIEQNAVCVDIHTSTAANTSLNHGCIHTAVMLPTKSSLDPPKLHMPGTVVSLSHGAFLNEFSLLKQHR